MKNIVNMLKIILGSLTSVYISLIFFLALTNNCSGEDDGDEEEPFDVAAPATGAELLRSSLNVHKYFTIKLILQVNVKIDNCGHKFIFQRMSQ